MDRSDESALGRVIRGLFCETVIVAEIKQEKPSATDGDLIHDARQCRVNTL